jgi:hypothetical protein
MRTEGRTQGKGNSRFSQLLCERGEEHVGLHLHIA